VNKKIESFKSLIIDQSKCCIKNRIQAGLTGNLEKRKLKAIRFIYVIQTKTSEYRCHIFRQYGNIQTKPIKRVELLSVSRLQPRPYSWSRDSQHTFGRSYTSTFGRSYTGTLEGAILAHSEETTGTFGRSYPSSDFRLNIKPGIPFNQNSSSS
jgi:hypothetical protein